MTMEKVKNPGLVGNWRTGVRNRWPRSGPLADSTSAGIISLELTRQLAPAPTPLTACAPQASDRVVSQHDPPPNSWFSLVWVAGPPLLGPANESRLGAPPSRPAAGGPAACESGWWADGGCMGVRGLAAAAPRGRGRRTVALGLCGAGPPRGFLQSASAYGAAAQRRQVAHFTSSLTRARGVRWARGCPVRPAAAQSRRPVGGHRRVPPCPSSAGAVGWPPCIPAESLPCSRVRYLCVWDFLLSSMIVLSRGSPISIEMGEGARVC